MRRNLVTQRRLLGRLTGLHLLAQRTQILCEGRDFLLLPEHSGIERIHRVLGEGQLDLEFVDSRGERLWAIGHGLAF